MAHPFRRLITALAAVVSVLAFSAACVPAGTPVAPPNDAIPSNGVPGWFQAGRQWQGDFGDPDILRVGGTYYAYSSGAGGRYLAVLTSTDLRSWTIHQQWSTGPAPWTTNTNAWKAGIPAEILADHETDGDKWDNNDALVRPASWGMNTPVNAWLDKTYWASSVIQMGNTWYAYSAVKVSPNGDPRDPHNYGRFCLTVASAPSPLGPFRDISGSGPIQCQPVSTDPSGSIDPYPYQAPNGHYYLLWKAAGKIGGAESSIMSQELGGNGKLLPGSHPVKLLQTNRAAAWEGSTIENPSMVTLNGVTYLFYSANDSAWLDADGRSNYATGYAVCSGPLGPCARPGGGKAPLLASNGVSQGPGGASPVVGPNGRLYLAYASYWLGENRSGYHPRRLHMAGLTQNSNHTLRVG